MGTFNVTTSNATEPNDWNHGNNPTHEDILKLIELICPIREDYVVRLIAFVIFIAFGGLGNITLLVIIFKDRQLRTAPNILISNLAIADLLYILVTGPINFEHEIHPCWFSGRIPCAIKNYAPVVCKCACVYSLVALSRERYSAIVQGMHALKSRTKFISLCWAIGAWVIGFVVAAPILTTNFSKVQEWFGISILCQSVERGSKRAKIYELTTFGIFYTIPLIFILIHYTKMAHFLIVSTNQFKHKNDSFKKQTVARRRLAYLAIAITIFFCVFSLPSFILSFMYQFTTSIELKGEPLTKFRHSCYFMTLINSSLNPYLVFILSSAHRERLKMCVLCRTPSKKKNVSNTMSMRMASTASVSEQRTRVLSFANDSEIQVSRG